jgi:hypothetical protein
MAQRIVNTTSTSVAAMKTEKTAMNTLSRYTCHTVAPQLIHDHDARFLSTERGGGVAR